MLRSSLRLLTIFLLGSIVAAAFAEEPAAIPPTPEQIADLKAAIETPGKAGDSRLQAAMKRPENEPLAQAMVKVARDYYRKIDRSDEPVAFRNLLYFLACRAGKDGKLHIDGPYLKDYATFLLEIVEEETSLAERWGLRTDYRPLLLYLVAHPEDQALRDRTLKLARKFARVSDLPPKPEVEEPGSSWAHRSWNQVTFAWNTLFTLKVLELEMDFAAAKKILGEPTSSQTYQGIVHPNWGVPTGFRFLTALRGEVVDGKITFHWRVR